MDEGSDEGSIVVQSFLKEEFIFLRFGAFFDEGFDVFVEVVDWGFEVLLEEVHLGEDFDAVFDGFQVDVIFLFL